MARIRCDVVAERKPRITGDLVASPPLRPVVLRAPLAFHFSLYCRSFRSVTGYLEPIRSKGFYRRTLGANLGLRKLSVPQRAHLASSVKILLTDSKGYLSAELRTTLIKQGDSIKPSLTSTSVINFLPAPLNPPSLTRFVKVSLPYKFLEPNLPLGNSSFEYSGII